MFEEDILYKFYNQLVAVGLGIPLALPGRNDCPLAKTSMNLNQQQVPTPNKNIDSDWN